MEELRVLGSDQATNLTVDLRLRRVLPLLMQGHGSGYVGDPKNGNGEAYYR